VTNYDPRPSCCGTRFGQYENIRYRPGAEVGICQKCERVWQRNYSTDAPMEWRLITYVIQEDPFS